MKKIFVLCSALWSFTVFADEKIQFNFPNEEITKIIEVYSKASSTRFIVDSTVRGKISLLNPSPLSLEDQVASIYAGTNGYLDVLPADRVRAFLVGLRQYLATNKPKYGEILKATTALNDEAQTLLKEALKEYTEEFLASAK